MVEFKSLDFSSWGEIVFCLFFFRGGGVVNRSVGPASVDRLSVMGDVQPKKKNHAQKLCADTR